MLRPFALALGLSAMACCAQDTLRVEAFTRTTVVTDPARGENAYRSRVRFPAPGAALRRIVATVALGCPEGMRCADWDYLDHLYARPLNSADTFELARLLTPYGGAFKSDWRFAWTADVTDFAPVLRDSVELIFVHGGYEPANDRGWALTVRFDCITGPPAAQVLQVEQLYRGRFRYGDPARSVEEDLPARTVRMQPKAEWLRVRINQTGHGMNEADGCGEFCSKWRSVKVDGREVGRRALWKECAGNPLSPQAGTWVFDRADWCPGELQEAEALHVPLVAGSLSQRTVDVDMEPYLRDSSAAFTDIAAYAVQLARPRTAFDAAIEAIEAPSDDPVHGRWNPAVREARIRIRNLGSEPMDQVVVTYGTEGFPEHSYVFSRRLRFGESATVVLPHLIDAAPGRNAFFARLGGPNGRKDAWPADNAMRSAFTAPDVLPERIIVQLRTNREPQHNSFRLASARGRLPIDRPAGTLRADSLYSDTLLLQPGAYAMLLADTAGDGLEFWYNAKGGRGYLRLLDAEGRLLKRFESDCGNGLQYQFRVGGAPTVAPDQRPDIGLFPTRTTGRTVLDFFANEPGLIVIKVLGEDGLEAEVIEPGRPVKELSVPIDLSAAPRGRYTVKVLRDGAEVFSKRLRLVDSVD